MMEQKHRKQTAVLYSIKQTKVCIIEKKDEAIKQTEVF